MDNPVNCGVVLYLSTGLSTLLITYIAVVQALRGGENPGLPGPTRVKPTRCPQLWITCGYWPVVKWVSVPVMGPGSPSKAAATNRRPRRPHSLACNRTWFWQRRQCGVVELSVKLGALSTARCTVGITVPGVRPTADRQHRRDKQRKSVDVHRSYPRLWIKLRTSVESRAGLVLWWSRHACLLGPHPGSAPPVTVHQVSVDNSYRLHECIHGGWADEGEALFPQCLG